MSQHLLKPGWIYVVEDVEVAAKHAEACLRRLGWRVHLFKTVAETVTDRVPVRTCGATGN